MSFFFEKDLMKCKKNSAEVPGGPLLLKRGMISAASSSPSAKPMVAILRPAPLTNNTRQ